MILNSIAQKPIISFGLGRTSLEISLGQSVTIYQATLYDASQYSLLAFSGRRNIFQFTVTPTARGTFPIVARLLRNNEGTEFYSNKITLTVV